MSIDDKAAGTRRNRGKIDGGRSRFAEYHIATPGIAASGSSAFVCPDNQVGNAVAIHISGAGNADTTTVIIGLTVDDKAAGARRNRRKIDGGRSRLAEHHIATPGIGAGCGIAEFRPDNQVGKAVAIHIAGTRNTAPTPVTQALAIDNKAAGTGSDGGEVDRRLYVLCNGIGY